MLADDLVFIAHSLYPKLSQDTLQKMVVFNSKVTAYSSDGTGVCIVSLIQVGDIVGYHGSSGVLWEFNLRDILRWCELIVKCGGKVRREEEEVFAIMALSSTLIREAAMILWTGCTLCTV